VTSGVSGAVNGATQPVKSGLQKVGDLLGN
jgi:hypothetical protein